MVIEPAQQLGRPPICVDWLIACVSGGASHCANGFQSIGEVVVGDQCVVEEWKIGVVEAVRGGGGGVEVCGPVV
eukprot:4416388-Amphidinium_carterae.1